MKDEGDFRQALNQLTSIIGATLDINNPLVNPTILEKFRSKTLMGIPIIVNGEVKSILIFSNSEAPYSFNETQLERAKILSNQVAFAIKNADLYEQIKKALEHEHYVAITLQRSLLPEDTPKIPGAEVGAYYAPTRAEEALVGGDFYDFVQLADGKVAVVIGDVSGKGIEAAAITAMVKYAIRSFIYKDPTPAYVLTQANNVVSMQLKLGSFVTLCYALYDPKTGSFDFANAGHPYPVHYSAAKGTYGLMETYSPVFGLIPNYSYTQVHEVLAGEDILPSIRMV